MAEKKCQHEQVKCLCCGEVGTPAHFLTSRKRGPRSPEAAEQSRRAAKARRVDVTLQEAAEAILDEMRGVVTYRGVTITRAGYLKSPFAGKRGGGVFGAKQYIRNVLEQPKD